MKTVQIICMIIMAGFFMMMCDKNPSDNGDGDTSLYSYSAYDSTGVKFVKGWLRLVQKDSVNFTGNWNFARVKDIDNIGPQVGSGELLGFLDGEDIFINLNPDWADNNVILLAPYKNDKMEGTWQYVGFPGIINEGTFIAKN